MMMMMMTTTKKEKKIQNSEIQLYSEWYPHLYGNTSTSIVSEMFAAISRAFFRAAVYSGDVLRIAW